MKRLLFILTSFIIAGELEVEGNLTVTEGVNASSFAGDGSGLTNLPSLGDMKPERIYRYQRPNGTSYSFTVPEGKFWILNNYANVSTYTSINNNGVYLSREAIQDILLLPGDTISNSGHSDVVFLTIYEYSISGSGTDQGMDYVEP
jgi:hypothetical protein